MHTTAFALKRGFQSWIRHARPLTLFFGLTPARYDMLFAIREAPGPLLQSSLRRILGVTAPTISTMLASLEDLGLVHRRIDPTDRRQRIVELTAEGRACITLTEYELVTSGFIDLSFDRAISGPRAYSPRACRHRGPSIRDNVARYADIEGDDKIGCAGTVDAYVRGVA